MCKCTTGNDLTLDGVMRVLRELARWLYGTQAEWLAAYYRSYHRICEEELGDDYQINQAGASRMLTGKQPIPRPMYVHYTIHDDLLRMDMSDYLSQVAITARQRQTYHDTLRDMVDHSTNLDPRDKEYIQGYDTVGESDCLEELLYRVMTVLIQDTVSLAA